MTNDQINEGNKLIAEFMGWTYFGFNDERLEGKYAPGWKRAANSAPFMTKGVFRVFLVRNHSQLKYNSSWDWMMPVVEKIEITYDERGLRPRFTIDTCFTKIWNDETIECHTFDGESKLESTWYAVVQFIKWHNDQKAVATPITGIA